jgi:hypothetical protein
MKCQDVRRTLSLFVEGRLALTGGPSFRATCRVRRVPQGARPAGALASERARAKPPPRDRGDLGRGGHRAGGRRGGWFFVYRELPRLAIVGYGVGAAADRRPGHAGSRACESDCAGPGPSPGPSAGLAALAAAPRTAQRDRRGDTASRGRADLPRDAPDGYCRGSHRGPHAHAGAAGAAADRPTGRGGDANPVARSPAPQPPVSRRRPRPAGDDPPRVPRASSSTLCGLGLEFTGVI